MPEEDSKLKERTAARREKLMKLREYATHDSWRCEYYQKCHCGLDLALEELGLPPMPIPAPRHTPPTNETRSK